MPQKDQEQDIVEIGSSDSEDESMDSSNLTELQQLNETLKQVYLEKIESEFSVPIMDILAEHLVNVADGERISIELRGSELLAAIQAEEVTLPTQRFHPKLLQPKPEAILKIEKREPQQDAVEDNTILGIISRFLVYKEIGKEIPLSLSPNELLKEIRENKITTDTLWYRTQLLNVVKKEIKDEKTSIGRKRDHNEVSDYPGDIATKKIKTEPEETLSTTNSLNSNQATIGYVHNSIFTSHNSTAAVAPTPPIAVATQPIPGLESSSDSDSDSDEDIDWSISGETAFNKYFTPR